MKSSNLLTIVAVVAVAFALFNLLVTINKVGDLNSITGYAEFDTGTADVEIESAVHIRFVVGEDALDWGTGSVNTDPATLDSVTSPYNDANWDCTPPDCPLDVGMDGGLELENYGNVNVDLYVDTTENADTFICDDDANCIATATHDFNWQFEDLGTTASCTDKDIDDVGGDEAFWSGWEDVCRSGDPCDVGGDGLFVCDEFLALDTDDTIEINFQLLVPISAPAGQRDVIITATAIESL